jgi:hypothetical protein
MGLLPSVEAIAQTYNTPGYADPTDAVADYNEYLREWASSDLGSQAISTRMEIPRGRVRTWQDGGKPDVVRGIETAREHGWVELDADSEAFRALNRLVAGVFSGGSISAEAFVPSFSAPDGWVESQLRDDLETIGAGWQVALSNSGNVEELRPDTSGSVLGRVLVALGAPAGGKTTVDRLPSYLYGSTSTSGLRSDFVRVYVANRAVSRDNRDFLQIREERSERYLDCVAALIGDVTDVEVWRGEKTVRFRDSALAILNMNID